MFIPFWRFLHHGLKPALTVFTGSMCTVTLLCHAPLSYAVGLGHLRVYSYLDKPLKAEIQLVGEAASMPQVSLGEAQDYEKAGLEFNPALANLQAKIIKKGTHYVLQIQSSQAFEESILNVIIKLKDEDNEITKIYKKFIEVEPEYKIKLSDAAQNTAKIDNNAPHNDKSDLQDALPIDEENAFKLSKNQKVAIKEPDAQDETIDTPAPKVIKSQQVRIYSTDSSVTKRRKKAPANASTNTARAAANASKTKLQEGLERFAAVETPPMSTNNPDRPTAVNRGNYEVEIRERNRLLLESSQPMLTGLKIPDATDAASQNLPNSPVATQMLEQKNLSGLNTQLGASSFGQLANAPASANVSAIASATSSNGAKATDKADNQTKGVMAWASNWWHDFKNHAQFLTAIWLLAGFALTFLLAFLAYFYGRREQNHYFTMLNSEIYDDTWDVQAKQTSDAASAQLSSLHERDPLTEALHDPFDDVFNEPFQPLKSEKI